MENATSIPLYMDNTQEWAYWDKLFSDEECDEIVKYCKSKKLSEALVNTTNDKLDNYRKSSVAFVDFNDMNWVSSRLINACLNLNERFFDFDLWGFGEGLQFTEYKSPGGKYDEHIDKALGGRIRKLSIVVQLTDPKKYSGGELELITSKTPVKIQRARGYMVMFPSYTLHRVTPMTKGTRHSLVGWLTGKPFK